MLVKAVRRSEPQVLRHVLKAIGRIGGEKALDLLAKLEPPASPSVVEALSFARILLSYRTGSTRFLVTPPAESELRPPAPESAMSLSVRVLDARHVEPMLAGTRRQLPGVDLSPRTGLAITCGSEYRVLLSDLLDERLGGSLGRPFVAGAIFKYRPCPEQFSLDAYLLSSPHETDRAVRPIYEQKVSCSAFGKRGAQRPDKQTKSDPDSAQLSSLPDTRLLGCDSRRVESPPCAASLKNVDAARV